MSYLQTIFICPVCKERQPLHCVKPGHFQPANLGVTCSHCETEFHVKISKIRGEPKKHKFDAEVLKIGEAFREQAKDGVQP